MPEPTIQFGRVILHKPKADGDLFRVLFKVKVIDNGNHREKHFQMPVDNENEGKILEEHFSRLSKLGAIKTDPAGHEIIRVEPCKTG